ncbi:aminomethyl-transferring glycine dehydrogenase subunit GcvPB [Agromyces aerolatus]|uniref:aminomethyl-transferring glycine dehydrogenase subunit GcvPB n=1 Tax=Agromyces sp. LY-1074 TaxID=3074080 RepID=UPI00285B9A45|nr:MULTISPECIES: aminomethyl-transferring glycine dehydrogenase subunit GcvPB [unclassified Agromyces]MDR5700515.1 aminomethyl-transferring glycine dehydrogenase subunit GcvPB [Agromyces sp. LY-1074]MDR5707036.1 aminomethyl-transferring glycine dehydrogenase subunit GcvPB [Agromyces sp. LY-1358]
MSRGAVRPYHAARWNEPVLFELGGPGRRGTVPPASWSDTDASALVPAALRRSTAPELPELAEPEVQRHYLRLSQETLGMIGISLFGTCTMKYNPRIVERLVSRPYIADVHPLQDPATMQGVLGVIHGLEQQLTALSGMAAFTFQPGGGAAAAFTHACVTRAYHAARGEGAQRTQIITTTQSHPSSPSTAHAAGFEIITLPVEADGYPSVDALRAAVSDRTAALMVNNPDDMGIYNPHITEWVEIVHEAGGLCFYDHANFNGVMTRLRAAELGFDACMFMLHKTFGGAKGGGGPAVGAYGCSAELAPFLPGPRVERSGDAFTLVEPDGGIGRVREYLGNVPIIVAAHAWITAMGADGMREAADLSVLANNYMEHRLLQVRGVTKAFPQMEMRRLEMTRFSLETVAAETGVTVADIQNRMTDFGIDAFWMSHEPWIVPEPFTPEAGEGWSLEDIDTWIDVLAHVIDEAYENPELVRTAPHNQAVARVDGSGLDDPAHWATTWRSYLRKQQKD